MEHGQPRAVLLGDSASFSELPDEAFIRLPHVLALVGVKQARVYNLMLKGKFPRPYKLGSVSMWRVGQIRHWLNNPNEWRAVEGQ